MEARDWRTTGEVEASGKGGEHEGETAERAGDAVEEEGDGDRKTVPRECESSIEWIFIIHE